MIAAGTVGRSVDPVRDSDPEARLRTGLTIAMGHHALTRDLDVMDAHIGKRQEHDVVEIARLLEVGNTDGDVIDHRIPPKPPPPPPSPPAPPFIRAAMPWRIRPFWPIFETCFIMRDIS